MHRSPAPWRRLLSSGALLTTCGLVGYLAITGAGAQSASASVHAVKKTTTTTRRTTTTKPPSTTTTTKPPVTTTTTSTTLPPVVSSYVIPLRGIDLDDYADGTSIAALTPEAATTMNYIKSLGANSVSIAFPIYTASLTSNTISLGATTPTPADLNVLIAAAKTNGLSVALRPLLNETNLRPAWRGVLAPSNRALWFTNYLKVMSPYLALAQADKVPTFQVMSELESLNGDVHVKALLAGAAKIYKGNLQIVSSWGKTGMIATAPASFAVDNYLPVKVPPTAPVSYLVTGLTSYLKQFKWPVPATKVNFAEVGISAQDNAYYFPSVSTLFAGNTVLNPQVQVNWFKANCAVVRTNKMLGISFWAIDFPGSPTAPATLANPSRFSPQAAQEISYCFSGR